MNTLREGEAKLKAAQQHCEKTLAQTSPQGQANIRRELDALQQEWDTLGKRMKDTQTSLVHAIKALETYDVSCEGLSRWLRETESQLKDYELKSTLPEKQAQVEKFKVRDVFSFFFSFCMMICWCLLTDLGVGMINTQGS